jgi:hypothetical protein
VEAVGLLRPLLLLRLLPRRLRAPLPLLLQIIGLPPRLALLLRLRARRPLTRSLNLEQALLMELEPRVTAAQAQPRGDSARSDRAHNVSAVRAAADAEAVTPVATPACERDAMLRAVHLVHDPATTDQPPKTALPRKTAPPLKAALPHKTALPRKMALPHNRLPPPPHPPQTPQ